MRSTTPPPGRVLTRLCPAKLNLALSVGPPDAETGYHPIASWMVALDWGDTLKLEALEESASGLSVAFAADAPRPQAVDWPREKDLAWRAHRLLEERVSRALPVRAEIEKRIPAGAGLGGGSSDAAGMLLGLNQLFGLGLRVDELVPLGRRLGSDVAFLVAGAGRPSMLATGYGETLDEVPRPRPFHAAVFLPDAKCPTPEVYRAFDAITAPTLDESRVRRLAEQERIDPRQLFNDLTEPAIRVAPTLRAVRDALAQATNRPVHVTGSGAAMFVLTDTAAEAAEVSARAAGCGIACVCAGLSAADH